MPALAYTAAIQDRIFRMLGIDLSTADTDTTKFIDNTWTSGSLTGGMALDALTQLQLMGQWFALVAPTSVPSELESLLVAKTVVLCAPKFQPDRMDAYVQAQSEAQMTLDTYARNLVTYDPGATPEASVLTVQNVRYYVVSNMIRRPPAWETVGGTARPKPRPFVPFEVIDANLERVMRRIWQMGDWIFARRKVTISISTSSVVTFSAGLGASETFDSWLSRKLYFDDTGSQGANFMEYTRDADDQARLDAYAGATTLTGRPRRFNITESSGTLTYWFSPPPDQTYTARGVCLIKGPTLDTLTNTTTALARFPTTFNHVIKDAVLAETLRHINDPHGEQLWRQVVEEVERLLPTYTGPGTPEREALQQRDVFDDLQNFTGGTATMGGWM